MDEKSNYIFKNKYSQGKSSEFNWIILKNRIKFFFQDRKIECHSSNIKFKLTGIKCVIKHKQIHRNIKIYSTLRAVNQKTRIDNKLSFQS